MNIFALLFSIFIFVILIFIILIILLFKNKLNFPLAHKEEFQRRKWPYRKKDYLFSVAELKFYKILKQIIYGELTIFAKVRLADVVYIPKYYSNNKYNFYRIQAKHIDYLICSNDRIKPLIAIELDDSSHNMPDRQKRDKFLEDMLEDAKLPLVRIKVSLSYDIENIKKQLKKYI
ncbi:DUF2726 domain-containing protein [Candidatus Parcubacteria bacterium]|nr:DUF2726 domain-containing protein [Candidatus Parcubacteria bacterium]